MPRLNNPHTPPRPWLLGAGLGLIALVAAAILGAGCSRSRLPSATVAQTGVPAAESGRAATSDVLAPIAPRGSATPDAPPKATTAPAETAVPDRLGASHVIAPRGSATPDVPPKPATAPTETAVADRLGAGGVATPAGGAATPGPQDPSPTPTPPAVASLSDALSHGWVRGEIRGYDAGPGDSVIVTLQRAIPQEITLTIPQGALLLSDNRDEPNMVAQRLRGALVEKDKIEPAEQIRLSDDRWQAYLLEAYSLNFGRGQASPSAAFLMVEAPSSEVSKVLEAADKAPAASVEALQTAIWAITDGVDQTDLAGQGVKPDIGAVRALFEAAGLDPTRKRLFDESKIVSAQQYMARGDSYYEKREYAQAIADYTRAIGLENSGYVDAFYRRGSAAVQVQDYEQAIADFSDVIRLRPGNPLGYYSRGIVQNAKPDPDDAAAIADLDQAIQLDPKLSDAYHARGLVYAARQEYERAIESLTQAIQIDPGFVLATHARGSVYSSMRDYSRAIADFSAAIGMKPDFAEAFRARGLAYAGLGDPVLAIQDFNQYLALKPEADDRQSVEETIAALQEKLPAPAVGGAIPLPEAMASGRVQAAMHGLGVASGDSILLTAQRAPGAPGQTLEIGVPQGLVLQSAAAGEGNMVVRRLHGVAVDDKQVQPASAIHLSDDEPQRYFLEAYSLDFHKNDPGASTAFSLGPAVDADTLRILEAADRMPQAGRDILALQAAIWVVRDDVTWEELIDRGAQPDLRVVRAILASAGIDLQSKKLFGVGASPAALLPAPTARPAKPPAAAPVPTAKAAPRPTPRPAPPAACPNPSVQITSPADNQGWSGSVKVLGNATHPDFQRFDLQFKSADAPDQDSSWRFLTTGTQPVQNNGALMEWVTTTVHPNGAYHLRLRVVQRNGNYEDCVITVQIRN